MNKKAENVVLITYSTTGNTKFVGESIANKLKNNFSVRLFDALSLIRELPIGNPKPLSSSGYFKTLEQALFFADVVGVGGFAFGFQTPPGLADIFSEEYLPHDLFKNMKYFFTFATCGQKIGVLHDILATILSEKNKDAVYAGRLTLITPENFSPLLPGKGFRDMWSQEQIDKIDPFVLSLSRIFSGEIKEKFEFEKKHFKTSWLMEKLAHWMCGDVRVDKSKCLKCGMCAKNCPFGALTIDIEDGFPKWNSKLCKGCHLCFNRCPVEAINMRNTENKSRHPSPFLDLATGAVISESADGSLKLKGIPLPPPNELNKRYLPFVRDVLFKLLVIIVVIVVLVIIFV